MPNREREQHLAQYRTELQALEVGDLIETLHAARRACDAATAAFAKGEANVEMDLAFLKCSEIEAELRDRLGPSFTVAYKSKFG